MDRFKYGIMGGTFNPIHMAHLFIAEEAKEEFGLEKILFIPTGNPPHKRNVNIEAFHRYNMAKLAISGNPDFLVSDIEIMNQDVSYSVDTLQKLREAYPHVDFYFITGTDQILTLEHWREPKKLMSLCKFVCVNRPCNDNEEAREKIKQIEENLGGKIYNITGPGLDISSTQIRDRVKSHKSIRYLVPDSVYEYIIKNRLYIE